MVDHELLEQSIDVNFGIHWMELDWIGTGLVLLNRLFGIIVNASYSATGNLVFSAPQKSCLWLTLYWACNNTMRQVVPNSVDIYGYAAGHIAKIIFIADRVQEVNDVRILEDSWKRVWQKMLMDNSRIKMNDGYKFSLFVLVLYNIHIERMCKIVMHNLFRIAQIQEYITTGQLF